MIGYGPERILPGLVEQVRAFLGAIAFEALRRSWVVEASMQGVLPLEGQQIGSHSGRGVNTRAQHALGAGIDVVALNWKARTVVLGKCK